MDVILKMGWLSKYWVKMDYCETTISLAPSEVETLIFQGDIDMLH